jgi:hypothetical protein
VWVAPPFQEGQEVRAVAVGPALAEDLARADVQRGEQVGGAVPDLFVGALLAGVELDGQQWLGPIQRLDLRLLVRTQYDRRSGGSRYVADDVGDLTHLAVPVERISQL